jgi:hypothetical protein
MESESRCFIAGLITLQGANPSKQREQHSSTNPLPQFIAFSHDYVDELLNGLWTAPRKRHPNSKTTDTKYQTNYNEE